MGFNYIKNRPWYPQENCCELILATIKACFWRLRLRHLAQRGKAENRALVEQVLAELDPDIERKTAAHGLDYWRNKPFWSEELKRYKLINTGH